MEAESASLSAFCVEHLSRFVESSVLARCHEIKCMKVPINVIIVISQAIGGHAL